MYEVQRHVTLSDHGYLGYAVIVNKKFWDGLPGGIRSDLEEAMKEATRYANQIAQKENDDALRAIRKTGKTIVYALSEQEKEEWRRVLLPVQKEMEARIGKALVAAVNRETALAYARK
jgi:C4-dicarboxylate-binding protein DctP